MEHFCKQQLFFFTVSLAHGEFITSSTLLLGSYKLVSVVTHIGPSQNCGHYTAIGQAPNGNYYQFDDSSVKPLPLSGVLATHAYIMFFEKDNGAMEDSLISAASTSNIVYGPQLPDNIMSRAKSPIKLPFYKSDERKSLLNLSNITTETSKSGVKPPVILNSTLSKSNASNSNSEPWVVNPNGDVEKVITTPKFLNGTKNDEDDNKNIIILKSLHCDDNNAKHRQFRNETELRTPEKNISSVKIVRLAKSPLEKLEEQMNNNVQRNGSSKLVPYDSESSGDERPDRNKEERLRKDQDVTVSKPSRCVSPRSLVVTTNSTHHTWTVSSESNAPLLSPSLNGVTNKKVKEKEENHQEDNNKSPNTSVSTMSPLSERSVSAPNSKAGSPVGAASIPPVPPAPPASLVGRHDTLRQLQHMSHRGYGAPVDSWPGHHSNMNRQVFEERRDERKRAMEGYDEMDHGRLKKVKKFHHCYNGFHGRSGYNPFQKQGHRVLYELKPRGVGRRFLTCELLLQRQKRKSVLHRIVTGAEKCIHYDNPKRRKSWGEPGHTSTSSAKPNIHGTTADTTTHATADGARPAPSYALCTYLIHI
ncbi:Ubiquitin carboxyl-terminal hydrolase 36 [Eumeta japonica]|uniref:Ubiquitin carboxyl-terminal hydrolase 36 n=1 Tax=Eumeta variegata TaxID=151549 RepID=A0A4C1XN74_EUMVA|nr:Ubiquitin carboxyl-terminal hydrolase 36 [Eumeta japonica]